MFTAFDDILGSAKYFYEEIRRKLLSGVLNFSVVSCKTNQNAVHLNL